MVEAINNNKRHIIAGWKGEPIQMELEEWIASRSYIQKIDIGKCF